MSRIDLPVAPRNPGARNPLAEIAYDPAGNRQGCSGGWANLFDEMLAAPHLIRTFDWQKTRELGTLIAADQRSIVIVAEGSSQIVPGHIAHATKEYAKSQRDVLVYGGVRAERWLRHTDAPAHVICISNSGKTAEVIRFAEKASSQDACASLTAITTNPESPLAKLATQCLQLRSGPEEAVAATKSVFEQALVLQSLLGFALGAHAPQPGHQRVAAAECLRALTASPPQDMVNALATAQTIYFAGESPVGAELALKCKEILGRNAAYFEGTTVLHGHEETMTPGDAVVLVDFSKQDSSSVVRVLEPLGVKLAAIDDRSIEGIPTLLIHTDEHFRPYFELAQGWGLLVSTAATDPEINPDKPKRARKVGNEVK